MADATAVTAVTDVTDVIADETDIETETEDMAADLAMTIHGREGTKAAGTMKIPASYEGIRAARHNAVCLVVGLLSLQSFLPSSPGVSLSSMRFPGR